MQTKTKLMLAAVPVFLIVGASSCDEKGLGDAPVGKALEDERLVITMPDTFPNYAVFCDGTTAVYGTTREAPPIAIADSDLCDGKGVDATGIDEGELKDIDEEDLG